MSGQDIASTERGDATAVIGMAGRFPGARSVDELWRNLLDGRRAIRRFTDEELADAGVPEHLRRHPSYVPVGADLDDIELFDADFFGLPAHEARLTDPQHRLFLETCWAALEDAGHPPRDFDGRIGVFGATSVSTYLLNLIAEEELPPDGISYPLLLGNDKDYLCTRTAHRLGLTGPAVTVQTACSSSLVAVHVAVQSLLAGECDIALAGGVSATVPQRSGYLYREGGILSADGHCRVFDAEAQGTVRGSGCGVVVLRRLDEAVADRDRVSAVIRGTAVNNDGSDKMGFTAPSAAGQTEVIREALAVSGVPSGAIGYVEAHGTGTSLGDPIEVRALTAALAADGDPPAECYLGSVKASLGHLDVAAGITGLIKTVLVLREQRIPAQVDYARPNERIGEHLSRYRIPAESTTPGSPLRAAGVSSFGLGGTNAHAILTPAPEEPRPAVPEDHLVPLSARDAGALATLAGRLRDHLATRPDIRLDDVALTLAEGRAHFATRVAWRASSVAELIALLDGYAAGARPPDDPAAADWLAGGRLDPALVGDVSRARRVPLPGHPLRPRRHWAEARPAPVPSTVSAGPSAGPAAGDLTERVRETIARMLDAPDLGVRDDFYELGLDSLRAVETVTVLRDTTGLPLSFDVFDGLRTVAEVAEHLYRLADGGSGTVDDPAGDPVSGSGGGSAGDPAGYRHLLSSIRTGSADGHVFLVPPAGGATAAYIDLARHVADERTLWALGYPAEQAARFRTVRDLAGLYTGLVRAAQPRGPYLLAGYSFGGSVAFQMAADLERAGERVERVVMLDSHPPEAYIGGVADRRAFLAAFPALVREILPSVAPPQSTPPREHETVEELVDRLCDGSWSSAMRAELVRFFHIWQDNHEALKRWLPDRPLSADIVVLAAEREENQAILSALDIRAAARELWAGHTTGRVEVVPVPGDHYSMIRNPDHLPQLGKIFAHALHGR